MSAASLDGVEVGGAVAVLFCPLARAVKGAWKISFKKFKRSVVSVF